jgi:LemA protein
MVIAVVSLILLALLVAFVGLWFVSTYNRLVRLRNNVTNSWAQVETELQRRIDMIPNLVATVKGYAAHEHSTLQDVINARAASMQAMPPSDALQAQDLLTAAVGKLIAVSERYPDLKADKSFLALQAELAQTENRVSYGRKVYNESVLLYNNAQQVFPAQLVAERLELEPAEPFEASPEASTPPTVSF